MSRKISGILFDKDGTLIDFDTTWIPAYRAAADNLAGKVGQLHRAEELMSAGGFEVEPRGWTADALLTSASNRDIVAFWAGLLAIPFSEDLLEEIESIFNRVAVSNAKVVTELPPLFACLRVRCSHLGLATMDTLKTALDTIRALRLENSLDFICGADSGYGEKPDPGMVHAFCRHSGLSSDEVAVIGDSPRDLIMARNAGCGLAVGVLSGAHRKGDLQHHADVILDSIADLPDLFGL